MRPSSLFSILLAATALTACAIPQTPPAAPPAPRAASPVRAPFDATWQAALTIATERGWPPRSVDKASGYLTTGVLRVPPADSLTRLVDCGTTGSKASPFLPDVAEVTMQVAPDGDAASRVHVIAQFRHVVGDRVTRCTSTGVLESDLERAITTRAEGR